MIKIALCGVIFALITLPVNAFGGGGGGGGGIPETFLTSVEEFQTSIETQDMSPNELLKHQFAGTLCEHHRCGFLSEEQASLFLDRLISSRQQQRDTARADFSLWISAGGGVIALLSFLISLIALIRVSKRGAN